MVACLIVGQGRFCQNGGVEGDKNGDGTPGNDIVWGNKCRY